MNKYLQKLPNGHVRLYRPDSLLRLVQENAASRQAAMQTDSSSASNTTANSDAHRDIISSDVIGGSEILIFGAGAVGSYMVRELAPFGVVINLVDFDIVDLKHTRNGRTIYEPTQVNKKKGFAAKYIIERDFPQTTVNPYICNVMDIPATELIRLAKKAAAVINAIDDPPAMLQINDILYGVIEVLYIALHARAASGHIILTIPHMSACLRCSLDVNSSGDMRTLHGEAGSGLDIRTVANHGAVVAAEIIRTKKTGLPIERWDITKNIFYLANKRDDLSPDGPGVHMEKAEKRSQCPICSVSPV
jgi:molybdopterin/thiamine biosynthesis adenylyltransferase